MKDVGGSDSLLQKLELRTSKLKKILLAVWYEIKTIRTVNIDARHLSVRPEVWEALEWRKNITLRSKTLSLPAYDYELEEYLQEQEDLSFEAS